MAEYINRNELVENLDRFAPEHLTPLIRTLIEKQPTADVVEVVRCKNCKHFYRDSCLNNVWGDSDPVPEVNDNDFCSYGIRRK